MSDILARLQKNDAEALTILFQQYHSKVYRFVLRFTKDEVSAADVTQTLFIKLWEKRQSLSTQKDLEAQIFTIAKNLAIDSLRAAERKRRHEATFVAQLNNASNTTENTVFANDFQQALDAAIQDLPPRRRTIFKMNRLEGKTYKEIAEQLSISPKTVEHQMSQALKTVRQKLAAFLHLFL